jgi:hypothetical protein
MFQSVVTSPLQARVWLAHIGSHSNVVCVQTAAWSGKGLYINNGNGYFAPRMPEIFTWNVGSDVSQGLWDFSSYVPDAVVINLGVRQKLYHRFSRADR